MKKAHKSFYPLFRLSFVLILSLVLIGSADAASTWVSTGGPLGGLGYDVRIHPTNKNTMYVTDNYAGVVKSDTAGQTWYQSNSGITIKGGPTGDAVNIFSLTIDPNNPNIIWAGTFGDGQNFGVFKSADAGANWTMKTNGITLGSDISLVFRGFTIQKGNSNIVYAQAETPTTTQGKDFNRVKGRVYKTVDGGENWQLVWQGDNLARYIIIDPANANVLYLSTGIFDREAFNSDCANNVRGGVGVLKSADAGSTWAPVNNGLTDLYVGSLRMHPTNSQILFAGTGNNACSWSQTYPNWIGGLYKTTNGGALWTKVVSNDIITTVNFSPSNPAVIYAGSSFAFYQSKDDGTTWSRLTSSSGLGYGPDGVHAGFPIDVVVDPDNPNVLYANNYGGGVFSSSDGAATWQVWSKGYSGADIHKVLIPSGSSSAIAVIGRSGPFVSSNYGEIWTGITNGDAAIGNFEWYAIAVQPANSNVILISDQHQGVIFRSTGGGSNFTEVLRHPNANASNQNTRQGFRAVEFAPSNPNVVYAGLAKYLNGVFTSSPTGTVIYKSTDAGATYTAMPSIIDGNNVSKLIVDPGNSNIVYAATTKGVYKSADGAINWSYFSSLGSKQIEGLAVKSGYIIAGERLGGIWISQDDGTTWTGPHNSGLSSSNPYMTSLVFDPSNSSIVYASDLYSGVYKSTDKGLTWSSFPDSTMSGLTVRAVKDLAVNDKALYAATQGGGVFRYALQDICAYTVSPPSRAFTPAGGTGSVSVTALLSSCAWTAAESLDWVSITSGSSGTGSGTVSYSVSANTSGVTRTGNMTLAGQTFSITQSGLYQYNFTVSKADTGTGVVTAGANCTLTWTGNTGACTINSDTTLALNATANPGSTFAGWSNGSGSAASCSGTGACSFNITADSSVTAAFAPCSNLAVRIGSAYYSSPQAAYNAASNGDTIQSQAVAFTEGLNLNKGIAVTIKGGYDCGYSTNNGHSTVSGTLTITLGSAVIENVTVQ